MNEIYIGKRPQTTGSSAGQQRIGPATPKSPQVSFTTSKIRLFNSSCPWEILLYCQCSLQGPTSTVLGKLIEEGNEILESLIIAVVNSLPASKSKLDEYREAQQTDPICSEVMRFCRNSWPQKKKVEKSLIPLGELTICGGLLLLGKRIVIPKCKQCETLQKIHEGH